MLAAVSLFSLDFFDTDTHIILTNMTDASPPTISGRNVIFSYEPETIARHIGIAFRHEDYRIVHSFSRNQHGVFVYVHRPPADIDSLTYRIVVDGLWMADPGNPRIAKDPTGVSLSFFPLDDIAEEPPVSPRITEQGEVEFFFRGEEGMLVYVAGSFNHWDPFMYRLRETAPGVYRTRLRLPEGVHSYYYVINGDAKTDPLNQQVAVNLEGRRVSVLMVD